MNNCGPEYDRFTPEEALHKLAEKDANGEPLEPNERQLLGKLRFATVLAGLEKQSKRIAVAEDDAQQAAFAAKYAVDRALAADTRLDKAAEQFAAMTAKLAALEAQLAAMMGKIEGANQ